MSKNTSRLNELTMVVLDKKNKTNGNEVIHTVCSHYSPRRMHLKKWSEYISDSVTTLRVILK